MAAYIRPLGSVIGHFASVTVDYIVANGVTVTAGDFVYFTSGTVTNATVSGGQRLIGMAVSTVVGDGTKTVKVLVSPYNKYLVQTSNGTFLSTHVGQFFNLTGATGVQTADVGSVSTSTASLLCLQYNPSIDPVKTDTTYGVFSIAKSYLHQ